MTISIHIEVPDDAVRRGMADGYLADALGALGYRKLTSETKWTAATEASQNTQAGIDAPEESCSSSETSDEQDSKPAVRLRGKPATGSRRTKVEIAEDEELEKLAAEVSVRIAAVDAHLEAGVSREEVLAGLKAAIAKKDPDYRPRESEPAANISTGEDRVDPAEEAQDAADEAAEQAEPGLTTFDLQNAVARYVKAFGIAAAQADIPAILGCSIADVKDEDIEAGIKAIDAGVARGPKEPRQPTEAAPTATTTELMEAMKAWSSTVDPEDASEKGAVIFESVLGPVPAGTTNAKGVEVPRWVLSAVPDDGALRAKCVAAFKAAVA